MVNRASVRWRCRRGMRELDLLFERFLARNFDALDDGQLQALERLLAEPDQDILAWLSQGATAPDAHRDIVDILRAGMK